ncbi:MAG TPA: hypothetical protein VFM88_10680 [Vicinamibacteria bacterium]|nr:hypothetical protein [Vicinamibacteria bacterium]
MSDGSRRHRRLPGFVRQFGLPLAMGGLPLLGILLPPATEPPQAWDQATHLLLAAGYANQVTKVSSAPVPADDMSNLYPPLYHLLVAAVFPWVGLTARAAAIVNAVMLVVLAAATYRAARLLFGPDPAPLAAGLTLASPFVSALAWQPLLDLTLTALVAAAVAQLLAPRFLATRRGVLCTALLWGAGLLAKWVFPLFVAGPVLVRLSGPAPQPRLRLGLGGAVLGAALLSATWYWPRASDLPALAGASVAMGELEGDPQGLSVESLTLYPRLVLDVYSSLPTRLWLVMALCMALGILLRRPAALETTAPAPSRPFIYLGAWLLPPYAFFTLLPNKDSRYLAPALPAFAILAAWAWSALPHRRARAWALALTVFYVVAGQLAGLSRGAGREAAAHEAFSLRGLAGIVERDIVAWSPPDGTGWPTERIVEEIGRRLTPLTPSASLAVLPDLPYVNPASFSWAACRQRVPLEAFHPMRAETGDGYSAWEYVVLRPAGDQGTRHATLLTAEITAALLAQPGLFARVGEFDSPGGSLVLLRSRRTIPPGDLRPVAGRIDLSDPAIRWHLGEGWSFREPWGRWALGDRAALRVQLAPGAAYRLGLVMSPPEELKDGQVVTVRYGGHHLASIALTNDPWDWRRWEVAIPERIATGGIDTLEFSFGDSVGPGPDGSRRPLAAAFRSVDFTPADE